MWPGQASRSRPSRSGGTLDEVRALRAEQVVYVHVNDAPPGVPLDDQIDNVRALPGEPARALEHAGDLLDEVSLIAVLRDHRPQEVYNLAAQSFVQTSWSQPVLTGETTASRIQLPHRAASSSPVMPMIGRPIRCPPAHKVPSP